VRDTQPPPTLKTLAIRYAIDEVVSILGMAVALFWAAGRWDWWPAWAAVAFMLVWMTAQGVILLRFNPDLIAERLRPPKEAKAWDKVIVSACRLLQLARYILAGLDARYGWTASFPAAAQVTALAVCCVGYGLFTWAMASNRFFSQVVRIQANRGHVVAMGGPYRFVRHPSYLGMILFELAMPTMLGSWPSMAVSAVCAALFVLRTALEDRTLQTELPGYAEYSREVRCRLLPGIW
jgi:protein-S-isoprenylcysteine O-methyltransferase Ste14